MRITERCRNHSEIPTTSAASRPCEGPGATEWRGHGAREGKRERKGRTRESERERASLTLPLEGLKERGIQREEKNERRRY